MVRRKYDASTEVKSVAARARWQPEDDLKLITAIEQINDIGTVHSAITFSCYFTVDELIGRWHELLFNKEVSTASQAEIELLPHDDRRTIIRKAALFSEDENRELQQCGVLDKPSLSFFEACLDRDNESGKVFHSSRTADCLYRQWLVLHKYRMLDGQEVPHPAHSQQHQDVQCCRIDDKELLIDPEQEVHARWNRRKILKLEAEILELQSYVETRDSIATLSGEFVDFEITNQMNTILIGRGDDVDVDLSNQIGSGRIHRKHALITVSNESERKFTLKNLGHRRVVVNGQQLLQQDEIELRHTSLIQMESIDLLFALTPSRSSTTSTYD